MKKATHNKDAVNLEQVNEASSVVSSTTERLFLKKDGTNLDSNLPVNNKKITDIALPSNDNDASNKKYTDVKIAKPHIGTHENLKNVFAYCMDNGELAVDFGIQGANLIYFNQMPHKINKRAFILKVKKTQDGSSLFKGRFDFNLFKLIQDNFSNNYTIALEIYFELFPFTEKEFNSVIISFEKINMYINHNATKK